MEVFLIFLVIIIGIFVIAGYAENKRYQNKKREGERKRKEAIEEARTLSGAFGDARFASEADCKDFGLLDDKGMTLGGSGLHYSGDQHLITISAPRTGKFTCAIAPALLTYPASCIVVDPKGQAAAVTARARREMGQKVFFLNPFNLHGLPDSGFNPLRLLDPKGDTFAADAAALSEALIIYSGGDTHWTDGARSLVECLIMWVCLTEENPSLPQVRDFLCLPPADFQAIMKKISAHAFFPMAQNAARFAGEDFRDNPGIISKAMIQTALLGEPLAARSLSSHSFDWQELKTGKATVYLILPAQYIQSHARWLRLLLVSAIYRLSTAEKGERSVLFVLDEFTQLGKLNAISSAFNLSAGYGIQLWLIFQSLPALEAVYGQDNESFLAGAGVTQIFRVNDAKTADYFSKRAGKYTKKVSSWSQQEISRKQAARGFTGVNPSIGEVAVDLLSPQNLYGFSASKGLLFVNGLEHPVNYDRVEYFRAAEYAGKFDPDPFHAPKQATPSAVAAPDLGAAELSAAELTPEEVAALMKKQGVGFIE